MGKTKKLKAKDRIEWYTKDYTDAVSLGVWKVERKFADEIKDAVKSQDLKLKLDKLSLRCLNSFIYSCLLQLRREDIYPNLNEENKALADIFDHRMFRRLVCDLMLYENQTKISQLRQLDGGQ